MKQHHIAILLAAMAAAVTLRGLADEQPEFRPPSGQAPRTASGKVDFSGVWQKPYVPDMTKNGADQKGMPELPFAPWGASDWKTYDATEGDYTGACLPFGLTRSINSPFPTQIIQNDKYFAFLFEQNSWFISIPLDGRPHRKDATWFGDSVGHWDGDTLVLDTVNFNGYTRLDTVGHPHSDQLHVIQRLTRPDLGHISYEVTIDDPKAFTTPWKNTRTFTLRPDWEIMEYSCEENNKSLWEGRIKVPKFPK